jgi:hypothetical protein
MPTVETRRPLAAGGRRPDRAATAQREAEDELFAGLDAAQRRRLAELLLAVRDGIADERSCPPDDEEGAGGDAAV